MLAGVTCERADIKSRDPQGKRDRPEIFASSTKAVPSWGTWRGTFLYVAFNSMHCICGHFSTLSTTSAETREISVKIVNSRETGLNCTQTASEDLKIKQLILNSLKDFNKFFQEGKRKHMY